MNPLRALIGSTRDVLGGLGARADNKDSSVIAEWGTVGWADDNAPVDFASTATDAPDGMDLVKVTLYRGRRPGFGKPLQPGLAAGIPVLAHLNDTMRKAPAAGTRVVVLFPGGDITRPANGAIVFVAAHSPQGFSATNAIVPVPDGSTIQIGDKNAVPVAKASPVQTAMDAVKAFANTCQSATDITVSGAATTLWNALGGLMPTPSTNAPIKTTKGELT